MGKRKTDELSVMKAAWNALAVLSPEARIRVTTWLAGKASDTTPPVPVPEQEDLFQ